MGRPEAFPKIHIALCFLASGRAQANGTSGALLVLCGKHLGDLLLFEYHCKLLLPRKFNNKFENMICLVRPGVSTDGWWLPGMKCDRLHYSRYRHKSELPSGDTGVIPLAVPTQCLRYSIGAW